MPINLIISSSKANDPKLLLYGFYRLDEYMISSEDKGLIAVFAIDCALFIAIVVIFVLTFLRRKNEENNNEQ